MNAVSPERYIFFITPAHPCSYLADKAAKMVFLDPYHPLTMADLSLLSRRGFRRSGTFVYRPECSHCRQCLSCRIDVSRFKPNRSQKRTQLENKDLRIETRPCSQATHVHYALFEQYINTRHADGDMYPPTPESFAKFIVDSSEDSFFLEAWLHDRLMGVAVCDQLDDGVSAVYTFFDPLETKRGLGTFMILQQIACVRKLDLPYVYLGYWVKDSAKMNYKIKFSGLDVFYQTEWIPFADDTDAPAE